MMTRGDPNTTLLVLAAAAASCSLTALVTHYLLTSRIQRQHKHHHQDLMRSSCCQQPSSSSNAELLLPPQQQRVGRKKPDPYDIRPRTNFLCWDDYFMAVAFLSAERSKDPNKQVGACIVNTDNIILSIGYNGFPRGCADTQLPWSKQAASGSILDTKYPYVVHAEANALLNKNQAQIAGARIYVTLFPCNECAKLLIQAGIKEVVFHEAKLEPTGKRPATMEQAAAEDAAADAAWDNTALPAPQRQQPGQTAAAAVSAGCQAGDTAQLLDAKLNSPSSTTSQTQQVNGNSSSSSSRSKARFGVGPTDLDASYVASQRLLTMAGVKLRQHKLQRSICVGQRCSCCCSNQ